MNNFQSPQNLPKKKGQFQSSSQQQRSTLQKSQETGGTPDIYHLTASFGMAESQQGGMKGYFKGQQEGLYYKTSQEKNQDYPRQLNEIQISEGITKDELNQRDQVLTQEYYQQGQEYDDAEQNYGGYQNPNELHFKSQEYNEDTLHQQQFQSVNSNAQSQKQSQQNWNKQRQKSNQGVQQPNKQNESKIHTYLQQMVDNTQSLRNTEDQIHNYMSLPNPMPSGSGSQYLQNYQTEELEVQRSITPIPEPIAPPQLTFSEIANMKQKQRQISQDKMKESKQKKLLDEIAHFYRQLAVNKKGEENSRTHMTSPSPIRKSESHSRLHNKSPLNKSIDRRTQQNSNKMLSHSRSGANTFKRDDEQVSQDRVANQSTAKENMRYSKDIHSQSVQQFTVSNSEKENEMENQENIQFIPNSNTERDPNKQMKGQQSRSILKGSRDKKQSNSHTTSIQSQQNMLSSKSESQLRNKDHKSSLNPLKLDTIQINMNDLENIHLIYAFYLTPIQFQTFERQLNKSDFNVTKFQIISKYQQLSENIRYSPERSNYLSTVQETLESCGIKQDFKINLAEELQIIGKISKKNILPNLKEVIELSDSYETITQDIQAIEGQRDRKRSARTTQQLEKDEQTVAVLKDMQMRITQKIFFLFAWKVQRGYKREIVKQLNEFEDAHNKLKLSLALNALKHYATIRSFKNQLGRITKSEIQNKRLKKMFDAIKAKGNKYIYYKPFIIAVRERHRQILKQNSIFSLFDYAQKRKNIDRKLELSRQIHNSHLITKSYLILKAFSNRKKSHQSVQTMTAKNISLQFTTELRLFIVQPDIHLNTQHFKWRFNSNDAIDNQDEPQYHSQEQAYKQSNLPQQSYRGTIEGQQKEQENVRFQEDLVNRDYQSERSGLNQRSSKYNEVQRHLNYNDYDLDTSDKVDQSYDSKQFQKHFYCEEEYLSSARNLLETKRQIALDKLDRLKYLANHQPDDQSSFLQRNREKVQEQNRISYEDSYEQSGIKQNIVELQSDSKLNLVQLPTVSINNEEILIRDEVSKQQIFYNQELEDSRFDERKECKSILTLEQHIKQIIRVLKKLSKKKESFKHKNPVDLLLKKDAFFQGSSEPSSTKNSGRSLLSKGLPHPLQEHQEMIKRIEENEKKQTCSYLFYHWKIVFLERTLAAEISLLNSLKKCKNVLNAFKFKYRNNNDICLLNQQIREEKIKTNIFSQWLEMAQESSQMNNGKLYHFQKKLCFRRILYFSAYSKIKRVADNFYLTNRKKNVLAKWASIAKDNKEIRDRHKLSLSKRYFTVWQARTQKITFLRRFWKRILYTPDEILFEKYGNKKNLLKAMLKSWRGIVIENENSMKQKLALKSAIQHRTVVMKTKAFFYWLKCIKMSKGLIKLFTSRIIKKSISSKLLLPWKEAVASQKCAVTVFRRKANLNTLFKGFHTLKIKYLQKKVAHNGFLRKFFSYWKCQKEYRQEILPRQYYNRKLVKKCFTSIIYSQLLQMRERAKLEKSTKFFLYHIKKFMQTCLSLWQKHSQKKKSKKLLKLKLKKYAEKNLKKRIFTAFKLNKIFKRLKIIQNQKAIEFRAVQYQKKYNLKRLLTEPHLNPQLQEILTIIHYWRAYAAKQKNIKFIQQRINKFHNRKILTSCFDGWQDLFNKMQTQKMKEQHSDEDSSAKYPLIHYKYNRNNLIDSTLQDNTQRQLKHQISNQSLSQNQQINQDFVSFSNTNQKEIEDLRNTYKNEYKSDRVCKTQPSVNKGETSLPTSSRPNLFLDTSNQPSQRSPRFLSNQSRNSKSPSSRSNSPNYNKSTLKTISSQENLRKSRKSVRFELDPKSQDYPTALTIHRFDYFDQKYNENEAFYQKLLSQKRHNTSQN